MDMLSTQAPSFDVERMSLPPNGSLPALAGLPELRRLGLSRCQTYAARILKQVDDRQVMVARKESSSKARQPEKWFCQGSRQPEKYWRAEAVTERVPAL
jgi:hypothetical protein